MISTWTWLIVYMSLMAYSHAFLSKFLVARPVVAMALRRHECASTGIRMSTSQNHSSIRAVGGIILNADERDLFNTLMDIVADGKLNTTIRVAGGWVRDKLLNIPGKPDIDIALDNMSGQEFALSINEWYLRNGQKRLKVGIVRINPAKSKHLETATVQMGNFAVDMVNMRTETYSNESRVPIIENGTPEEDAHRRDLTINAMYFNINKNTIEDFTGRGLSDLTMGIVCTPLPALTTLLDDPLRALRAVRFACRFQFDISPDILVASMQPEVRSALAVKISRERITDELDQILRTAYAARAAVIFYRLGLMHSIFFIPREKDVAMDLKRLDQKEKYPTELFSSTALHDGNEVVHANYAACTNILLILELLTQLSSKTSSLKPGSPAAAPAALATPAATAAPAVSELKRAERQGKARSNLGSSELEFLDEVRAVLIRCERFSSELQEMCLNDDMMRILRYATLTQFAQDWSYSKTAASNKQANRSMKSSKNLKRTDLTEFILQSSLKVTNKDLSALKTLNASSNAFRELILDLCNGYRLDSSTVKDAPPGVVDRLQLGLAVRAGGKHYAYSIAHATARVLIEVMADSADFCQPINDINSLNAILCSLAHMCGIDYYSYDPLSTRKAEIKWSREEYSSVKRVLETSDLIFKTIEDWNLKDSWSLSHRFDGDAVQSMLKDKIPKGPAFAKIMNQQICWQLKYPEGDDEALKNYLLSVEVPSSARDQSEV